MNKLNILPCIIATALSSSLIFSSSVDAATTGQNLIVNGNAEQGKCDPVGNAVGEAIPGWTPTGIFSVLCYGATGFQFVNPRGDTVTVGGLPNANSPGSTNRGKAFFYGGGDRASSSASQLINISDLSSIIDGGKGAYNLSGWLGGYNNDADSAILNVSFLGQNNQSLGSTSITSPTAQQRNSVTGLFLQSTSGIVPVGTRQINVLLNADYKQGRVNDAYFDNLSFVITPVPEPSMAPMSFVGLSVFVAWKVRRNVQNKGI